MLSTLLDNKTFPLVADGLVDGNQRTVAGVAWALTSSRNYPPTCCSGCSNTRRCRRPRGQHRDAAQQARLNVRDLLQRAYNQEPNEKAALFRIIGEIADETLVPELISRLEGKDPIARMHIINILSRFNRPDVAQGAAAAAQGHATS